MVWAIGQLMVCLMKRMYYIKMNNAVNIQDAGLKENDVIYSIYGEVIDSVETLVRLTNKYKWRKALLLECFRNQQKLKVSLVLD